MAEKLGIVVDVMCMLPVRSVLFLIAFLFVIVTGQNETVTATLSESFVYSPGYALGAYDANVTYDYRISTSITNHTVTMTVSDCEMEFYNIKGQIFCNFDVLKIYDGYNSSAALLGEFCCPTGVALPSYQTTGDTAYILFTSDAATQYKGVMISIISDGPTTTTTTTQADTTTTIQMKASTEAKKNYTWIIVGSVIGGVNLIIIIVVIVVCIVKNSNSEVNPADDNATNRVLWSRSTTVEPISVKAVPQGEVVQTNIFDIDLPTADGKANQLPPLEVSLEPTELGNSLIPK